MMCSELAKVRPEWRAADSLPSQLRDQCHSTNCCKRENHDSDKTDDYINEPPPGRIAPCDKSGDVSDTKLQNLLNRDVGKVHQLFPGDVAIGHKCVRLACQLEVTTLLIEVNFNSVAHKKATG